MQDVSSVDYHFHQINRCHFSGNEPVVLVTVMQCLCLNLTKHIEKKVEKGKNNEED